MNTVKSKLTELQIMQNDALRFCKGGKMLGKVSKAKIHDSIGLEQRRQKQVFSIMLTHAKKRKI